MSQSPNSQNALIEALERLADRVWESCNDGAGDPIERKWGAHTAEAYQLAREAVNNARQSGPSDELRDAEEALLKACGYFTIDGESTVGTELNSDPIYRRTVARAKERRSATSGSQG